MLHQRRGIMIKISVKRLYNVLFDHYGPRSWWPAESRFEVMVGAILTQNTNWHNVEKAITNLKSEKLLTPEGISSTRLPKLESLVRPTGYYRQKARRLKYFVTYLVKSYDADLDLFLGKPLDELRPELLELNGIGPETADSILLYAGEKPIFVIDAYTKRLAERLDLTDDTSYNGLQKFFMAKLPQDVQLYNEYHALIVELCKSICKTKPNCNICILQKHCTYFSIKYELL
jgi:endonuclease-3 related protein